MGKNELERLEGREYDNFALLENGTIKQYCLGNHEQCVLVLNMSQGEEE